MALRQDVSARRFRTDTPRLTGWGSPALACALTHWFSRCCQSAGGSARRALSFSAACAARHWPAHSRSWPSGSRSDARRRPGACAGRGSSAAASAALSRSKRASTSACAPRCAAYLRAGRMVVRVGHRRVLIPLVTSRPVLPWLHARCRGIELIGSARAGSSSRAARRAAARTRCESTTLHVTPSVAALEARHRGLTSGLPARAAGAGARHSTRGSPTAAEGARKPVVRRRESKSRGCVKGAGV